ncbi:putative ribonuclease H-like domain-containing protein [Tanacetum coccineum]
MRPFVCPVTILNTIDHLGKFDSKAEEGFFVGYSLNSKAFRVFNSRTRIVEENLHIRYTVLMVLPGGLRDDKNDGAVADINNFGYKSKFSPIQLQEFIKCILFIMIGDFQSTSTNKKMIKNLGNMENPKGNSKYIEVTKLDKAMTEEHHNSSIRSLDIRGFTKWKKGLYALMDPDLLDRVYKVEKALYGLHQAPRAWYEALSTYLLDNGFQRVKIDNTLFIIRHKGDIFLVQVYVDDIIFGSTKKELCNAFEKLMHEKFQMSSMGELTFFLGLQVKQKKDGIFISQYKYMEEILKKFGFTEVKSASTPMETQKPLLKDEDGEEVDVHMYRSMIGSLMYLTSSRPDIMFAVCACARYQVNPKVLHLHAVKRIFRYLKGQSKLGLWYPKDSPFDLVAYTNSDYAGASLDRKSTTGGCQFLRCRLISWQCKKQIVVANSTTEAEYVAASSCCGQVFWIQNQLLDYGYNFMHTKIFIDNYSTICIIKNPVFYSKTKHIEIRHHFIRDCNEKKLIQMIKIHTDVAYLLTKAFDERMTRMEWKSLFGMELKLMLFWSTTKAKTINEETQIHALVDGKKIVITESSVRRDLQLVDKEGKDFSGKVTPLFATMLVQHQSAVGEGVNTPRSDEDSLKLKELMEFCTKLQQRVLDLENTKTAQAAEITNLKKRVKKLEKKGGSRTYKLKRLSKIGRKAMTVSTDKEDLGEEDASKQGRKIVDIDADEGITLVDEIAENQGGLMKKKVVCSFMGIKSTTPKAKGVVTQEPGESTIIKPQQQHSKDKDKSIMTELEKPLRKKDQIRLDEEVALRLQAELQAEVEEEERIEREKAEEANIALIESWDNIQAKIDADYQLAEQLQAKEQKELTIKEKSTLFKQLLETRRKHFVVQRAGEELMQESAKKQKVQEDKETVELQKLMEIDPAEEEVAIDVVPLATKPPSIVD